MVDAARFFDRPREPTRVTAKDCAVAVPIARDAIVRQPPSVEEASHAPDSSPRATNATSIASPGIGQFSGAKVSSTNAFVASQPDVHPRVFSPLMETSMCSTDRAVVSAKRQ